jgi:hypothetical protein
MAESHLPTWAEVGVPEELVAALKNLYDPEPLESIVHDRVLHLVRPISCRYTCGVCGHAHRPKKLTDDYGECERCESRAIRAAFYARDMNRQYDRGCSSNEQFSQEVFAAMRKNLGAYLGRPMEEGEIAEFGWTGGSFRIRYLSGEEVTDGSVSRGMVRAAVLVPALWDRTFDWKDGRRRPATRNGYLAPTLFEWVRAGKQRSRL